MTKYKLYILFTLLVLIYSCTKPSCTEPEETPPPAKLKTENVIIIVMDGARYSETWGDTSHQYIPNIANLMKPKGIINTAFYNDGFTLTNPGHTAITTGKQQNIDNTGLEIPNYPSIFQYYLKSTNNDSTDAWIITSKDKLEILSNCNDTAWKDKYRPASNCGVNGIGTGYRHDSITYRKVTEILTDYHPHLVLINFREPDYSGHTGVWDNYIAGVESSDYYANKVLEFIEQDDIYKNTTALFLINDHGRHLDSIADGFVSHGDGCDGCRHIIFYAYGPDFFTDKVINNHRSLIDIPSTTAKLLDFEFNTGDGNEIDEIFN